MSARVMGHHQARNAARRDVIEHEAAHGVWRSSAFELVEGLVQQHGLGLWKKRVQHQRHAGALPARQRVRRPVAQSRKVPPRRARRRPWRAAPHGGPRGMPNSRFSATLRCGNRESGWNSRPMRRRSGGEAVEAARRRGFTLPVGGEGGFEVAGDHRRAGSTCRIRSLPSASRVSPASMASEKGATSCQPGKGFYRQAIKPQRHRGLPSRAAARKATSGGTASASAKAAVSGPVATRGGQRHRFHRQCAVTSGRNELCRHELAERHRETNGSRSGRRAP